MHKLRGMITFLAHPMHGQVSPYAITLTPSHGPSPRPAMALALTLTLPLASPTRCTPRSTAQFAASE